MDANTSSGSDSSNPPIGIPDLEDGHLKSNTPITSLVRDLEEEETSVPLDFSTTSTPITTVEISEDVESQNCKPSHKIDIAHPLIPDEDDTEQHEEDFTIFHCVSYLGASTIREPRSEQEIHEVMSFLNEQPIEKLIQVSVSVPLYSNGNVIVYEEENQMEICRFGVSQIIFFARGLADSADWSCFAFTSSHGVTIEIAIFQCHVFRCDVPEAVGRVFSTFARTFASPSKPLASKARLSESEVTKLGSGDKSLEAGSNSEAVNILFEVSLELKEDDGKGSYNSVPRDKGFFKLRSCVPKQIVLTVQQLPDPARELIVERCFGLLLSPGRHVRHSDMQLVEMLSWSIGSQGQGGKTYVITGQWDANDPAFESLNHETPKESHVFFTVAVDLVIKGIQEPIRFTLETKGKIYPSTERFWMLVRKHHFTQQFLLSLKQIEGTKPGEVLYIVISNTPEGEVDRSRMNFNLNFTSFIRSASINSDLDTPIGQDDQEDSDDDEPLQSGMGEISKHCTDEQLASWSEVLKSSTWPPNSTTRPKQLSILVRNGIPDTIRGEIWLRLSGCDNDAVMMNNYRALLNKECPNEEIILRDITRTFPANDYFRESGGTGQEQLYRISKAYSIFDTEVGYCQGIGFITAALLLQMPEEQAFCLLVKIMYDYEFRHLYRDGFENLRLKLYQLDRLIEDFIPELWAHFQELGIESHMYANQWFLTLYTAKFPLTFVFRVLDSFFLDGVKFLFQIAIALLTSARKDLLMLDFEGILKYFRITLPKRHRNLEATSQVIRVAHTIKVKKLKRYETVYLAIREQERNYVDPLERLQRENKTLMENMLRSEHMITNIVLGKLTAEERLAHVEDELSKTRIALKEVEEFNQKLKEETNSVKELFQREVKNYDTEAEKKSNIIAEYKRICTKLSSQLEAEQKVSKERSVFFQSNLCQTCSAFVVTALQIASNKEQANGELPSGGSSPLSSGGGGTGSPEHGAHSVQDQDSLKPLENELARTKIALAEAECRNDDLNHQLLLSQAELEICRTSHGLSGASRIWKNLTSSGSGRESKRSSIEEGNNSNVSLGNGSGSNSITSSVSLQSFSRK